MIKKMWLPGEHLSTQQSSAKRTSFGQRQRRYTVYFIIDSDGTPVWTGSGVKPQQRTIDRVMRYVATGKDT